MSAALLEAGLRMTRQRKAVLDYLAPSAVHPSARQVFDEVSKAYPEISLATVYNTLATLVRMDLVKVMEFDALDNRYDTNLSPHINLICTSCGKIQDLKEGLPAQPARVKNETGFEVLDYRMEYYGICEACRSGTQKQREK